MKNSFLLIIILTILSCCSKDENLSIAQLPPETQTGANKVGCLVNGKVYLPSQRGINAEVNCFYQLVNGDYFFLIAFADEANFGPLISVSSGKINLVAGQTYILNKNSIDNGDYAGGGGAYRISSSNKFYTNTNQTGELKITKLDPQNSIISGTFWFDAVNSSGQIVQIRLGRFDWNY